ncbi:rano class II histocompatibility antigen, A beta chain-like isoform X1 [Cetorhinus maximus]
MIGVFVLLVSGLFQTLGAHMLQAQFSIEKSHHPAVSLRFAYDGTELIQFNYTTNQFVATKPLAKSFTEQLNSDQKVVRRYIRYGSFANLVSDVVLRAARQLIAKPSVNITAHRLHSGKDPLLLICRVNGFYPRGINATWLHNGDAFEQEVLSSRILPNTDGTFQVLFQISIAPRSGDTYTCQVEHSSSPNKLTAIWAPKMKSWQTYGYATGIVFMILGIIVLAGGISRWRGLHACGSQPGPNQSQVNTRTDAYSSNMDLGVWTQGEAEHLYVESERTPSPITT